MGERCRPPSRPPPCRTPSSTSGCPSSCSRCVSRPRYFAVNADLVELRVRIFPSRLHVAVDRPGIDPIERDQTIAYWRTRHDAGDDATDTQSAWERLVQLFGDVRAQYLRRSLTPTVAANGSLTFPDVPVADPDDDAVLSASATGLPTRFFVAGYQGDQQVFRVAGSDVPAEVAVGPAGDDAAIRWQTDFAAAGGHRPRRPPAAADPDGGGADPPGGVRRARGGRRGHQRRGARTSADDPLPARRRRPARPWHADEQHPGGAHADPRTGHRGAAGCGQRTGPAGDRARPRRARSSRRSAGGDDVTEPAITAMHAAMWQATFQYFFDSMQSTPATPQLVARARSLYATSVRPDGPLRTVLVGNQPYGVLPVSPLSRWIRRRRRTRSAGGRAALDGAGVARGRRLRAPARRRGRHRRPAQRRARHQSPRSVRWLTRHARSILIAAALTGTTDRPGWPGAGDAPGVADDDDEHPRDPGAGTADPSPAAPAPSDLLRRRSAPADPAARGAAGRRPQRPAGRELHRVRSPPPRCNRFATAPSTGRRRRPCCTCSCATPRCW